MEKKNIYIVFVFIVIIFLSISAWYYFGINYWTSIDSWKKIYDPLKDNNESDLSVVSWTNDIFDIISTWVIEELNKKNNNEKLPDKKIEIKTWVLESSWTWKLQKIDEKKHDYYDFESDNSIHKFVTSTKSFNNLWYIPNNLKPISSWYVFDSKWWQVLREEANNALQEMAEKFFSEKNEKISVVSAYRSYQYQVWIKKWWCPDNLCAKAGFSEHQSWLVVDLWSASNEETWKNNQKLSSYFDWLKENAHNFGFHNTYQKWLKIDGYEPEPWHWRYLWKDLAIYLKENNLTIAEYYKSL